MKNNINTKDTNNSECDLFDFENDEILNHKLSIMKIKQKSKEEINQLFSQCRIKHPIHLDDINIDNEASLEDFQKKIDEKIEAILIDIYENKAINMRNPLTLESKNFMKVLNYLISQLTPHFSVFVLEILSKKIVKFIKELKTKAPSSLSLRKIVIISEIMLESGKDIAAVFNAALKSVDAFPIEKIVMEAYVKAFVNGDIENTTNAPSIEKEKIYEMIDEYSGNYMEEFVMYLKECEGKGDENIGSKFSEGSDIIEKTLDFELNDESFEEEKKSDENEIDIDDLVSYINNKNDDKKKKRKKKKKVKKSLSPLIERQFQIEDDCEVQNFKQNITQCSACAFITKKIKPNFSKEWLSYLDRLIRQNI